MIDSSPFAPTLEQLPEEIPVFPLPGALLLPRGHLPLNIFEPRYLAMVRSALGARQRLIGMIQPRGGEGGDVGAGELFETGCAGRITSFAETDDGRYLITLSGVSRFRVTTELPQHIAGFRHVRADFAAFSGDLEPDTTEGSIDRERLKGVLEAYFDQNKIRACWDSLAQTDDETLVTSLAMACSFPPTEKQALLESENLYDRCQTLIALLEMALHGSGPIGRPNA